MKFLRQLIAYLISTIGVLLAGCSFALIRAAQWIAGDD